MVLEEKSIKGKTLIKIKSINIGKLKLHGSNSIQMKRRDIVNSTVKVTESELMRILKHLENIESPVGEEYELSSIISLKVGKNTKRYNKLTSRKGTLSLLEVDKSGHIKDVNTYVSQFTGAGHSRCQKSLFIRNDLSNKVDEICRCGIPKDLVYNRPSKWNAYYAMVTTDSVPLKNMPNIIVVDDFEKYVKGNVDLVEETLDEKGRRKWWVNNNVRANTKIKPFDGAGLVTCQCAAKWSLELNCRNYSGKRYIPSSFQFRAIPGIKGNLYVADIYEFAKQHGTYKIKDIWGKVWDIRKTKVDCIMSRSQFKFADLYNSFGHWQKEFKTNLYGYHRTFNISDYSEAPEDLKRQLLLSYQPLQTIFFEDEERSNLCRYTIEKYKNICTDVEEFIKYRSLTGSDDENVERVNDIPPYYKALLQNKELFNDKYIRNKVQEDIKGLKNKILSGKTFVDGNYQVLTVDVYAMLEYSFGLPVVGLLQKNKIYSNYWNTILAGKENDEKEIDIIRNPHIATEHRIGRLSNSTRMQKWFKYQNTGIITGIHDTILLALNSADADGDHVGTIYDENIINAVKREIKKGNARTIDYKPLKRSGKNLSLRTDDVLGLMRVNINSFKNDIGDVVNEISKLWSMELTDEIHDAIKIMSIIGSLTIDFAKTGEIAEIPDSIKDLLRGIKKPWFMRYLHQNKKLVTAEERAIRNIDGLGNGADKALLEKAKKFSDTKCNMNLLSHYYESAIATIDFFSENWRQDQEYGVSMIKNMNAPVNRRVKAELENLHSLFQEYSKSYNVSFCKNSDEKRDCKSHYEFFYSYCRERLLFLENNIEVLLDILLKIYYVSPQYKNRSKDILWNAFPDEMINRATNRSNTLNAKDELLKKQMLKMDKRNETKKKIENQIQKSKSPKVEIRLLDSSKYTENEIIFFSSDREYIKNCICSKNGIVDIKQKDILSMRRLYSILFIISKKLESTEPCYIIKSGKKNGISDTVISKMAKIDKRKILYSLSVLEKLGLIEINRRNMAEIKIKVFYRNDKEENGAELIHTDDYNKAASTIRYIFR